MKKTQCFLMSIIIIVLTIQPFSANGADIILTSDGKVPGKPFIILQEQIDSLQAQIDNLEKGVVKAYVNKGGGIALQPGDANAISLVSLNLPAGDYISMITVQATFHPGGSYVHDTLTSLSCSFEDLGGNPITGHLFGGNVTGQYSHGITMELSLYQDTEIFCKCKHNPFSEYAEEPLDINSIVWTAIKADELDNQLPID